MLWPVWAGLALLIVALSWRDDPRPALAIFGGLIVAQLAGPLPIEWRHLSFFVLWLGIGGLIARAFDAPATGALILLSAMCYLWARLAGANATLGSLPLVVSDLFGVLALLVAGSGGARDIFARIWHMGMGHNRGDHHVVGLVQGAKKESRG